MEQADGYLIWNSCGFPTMANHNVSSKKGLLLKWLVSFLLMIETENYLYKKMLIISQQFNNSNVLNHVQCKRYGKF